MTLMIPEQSTAAAYHNLLDQAEDIQRLLVKKACLEFHRVLFTEFGCMGLVNV